ncbi:MAG: hypothetical protein K6F35_01300 [Lachnospiraceae bacterium]|nr:hypothetical protein [Lachnospiraceae bacterium]
MSIEQRIEETDRLLRETHAKILKLQKEKKELDSALALPKNQLMELKAPERFRKERQEIQKFLRIAQNHTSLRPDPKTTEPILPDLSYLSLITFRLSDSVSEEDPLAEEIVKLCAAYEAYLEQEEKKEEQGRILALKTEEKRLSHEKEQLKLEAGTLLFRAEEHIRNDLLPELERELLREPGEHELLLGHSFRSVDMPASFSPIFKEALGSHYDENACGIALPLILSAGEGARIFVDYDPALKPAIQSALQDFALAYLEAVPADQAHIVLIDRIHYNGSLLGKLSLLSGLPGGAVEAVPRDEESAGKLLASIRQYYRRIEDERLGGMDVLSFNRQNPDQKQIPGLLLIIHQRDGGYYGGGSRDLEVLLANAKRYGILSLVLNQCPGEDKARKERAMAAKQADPGAYGIASEGGQFLRYAASGWERFVFHARGEELTEQKIDALKQKLVRKDQGTRYFDRFPMHLPKRSRGAAPVIEVPVAVDENDEPVMLNLERDSFAAYIMGSAGSGKSVLLHDIIVGLVMNYHPDEVELWLADFNKVEFSTYIDHPFPHIRYILLDDSCDLVYDLMDRLVRESRRRERILSDKNVTDLRFLPEGDRLPVIVVIIDEFARMSAVLRKRPEYQKSLTDLLQVGRKQGFKFIFASQNYMDGVDGLETEGRNQIANRIAMRNNSQTEMKEVLSLGPELTDEIEEWIRSLPRYQSIIKTPDPLKKYRVRRVRNLYPSSLENDPMKDIRKLADLFAGHMAPSEDPAGDDLLYVRKQSFYLDGAKPRTFRSHREDILRAEKEMEGELLYGDIPIYPGVPRGLTPVKRFVLIPESGENILVLSGQAAGSCFSLTIGRLLLSLLNSYRMRDERAEVFAYRRDPIYRRFEDRWGRLPCYTDLDELCARIRSLKEKVRQKKECPELVILLGIESLYHAFSLCGDEPEETGGDGGEDIAALMNRDKRNELEEEDIRHYREERAKEITDEEKPQPSGRYDAKPDLEWLFRRGGEMGLHFVLVCPDPGMLERMSLPMELFTHQILLEMNESLLRSYVGLDQAELLNLSEDGLGFYQRYRQGFSFRTHLYQGMPMGGFELDDAGNIRRSGY